MPRRLILASASPRRRELLSLLGLPFEVIVSDVDETPQPDLSPRALVEQLASFKASHVARSLFDISLVGSRPNLHRHIVVIGADTEVVAERTDPAAVLGKPRDGVDAARMLRVLSGTSHTVISGVSVCEILDVSEDEDFDVRTRTETVETTVQFRELTDEMIEAYVATGEPMDKAGAYGIQGGAAPFVEAVYGDYFNVVGLPVQTVGRMLEEIEIEWWRGPAALE